MLHATRTALFRRLTWLAGLGVAGASLLVLSMTAAAAGPDGRRLTLGANGPTAQAPAAMPMQSDQMVSLAAMSPPPAARATEVVRIQDTPASAEQPAIRVAPTTPRIEPSGPTAKAEPVTPKAVPVSDKSDRTARRSPGPLRANVKAPNTRVVVHDRRVRVNAPHTRVAVDEGRVRVRAPYVDLDIRF